MSNKTEHKCMDRKRLEAFTEDFGKLVQKHKICAWEVMFLSLHLLTASIGRQNENDPINAILNLLKTKDVPLKYKKSKFTDPMVG